MKIRTKSLSLWKIPFLFLIGIGAWVVLFPSQFAMLAEMYSEYKVIAKDNERAEQVRAIPPPDIFIESVCDEKLAEHEGAKVQSAYGCTSVACPQDSPCCNSCFFKGWKIEGTPYVLSPKLEVFSKCSLDGCGTIQNCPTSFILSELRKNCTTDR
jgi:hypothetical protein